MPWHPPDIQSHTPALARPAAVMRYRRHVPDRGDREAGRLQRPQCRFAARTGARDFDLERAHAVFHGLLRRVLGGNLRRVRRGLARTLEAHGARRRPGNRIALRVGNRNHRIVERSADMRDTRSDILAFTFTDAGFLTHHQSFHGSAPEAGTVALSCSGGQVNGRHENYFFLPAIAFAGPLRVRALVWVRWPRTGNPRR